VHGAGFPVLRGLVGALPHAEPFLTGALQLPFRECEQDVEDHPAVRGPRIDAQVHGDELASGVVDALDELQPVRDAASEARQFGDDHAAELAAIERRHHLCQFRAGVAFLAGLVQILVPPDDLRTELLRTGLDLGALFLRAVEGLALAPIDFRDPYVAC